AHCLALEAELATLHDKSHQENQGELIKHFSKLEVDHLNLQLKYQNLKDSIRNNPPPPDKDTPNFDSVFVIGKMQASLQEKDNATRSDTDRTLRVQTTDSQITKFTDHVTQLQAQNDLFGVENDKNQTALQRVHAVDVEPIVPRLRNNRDAHLDYLRHLKGSVETIRDIVEEAKVALNNELNSLPTLFLLGKSKLLLPNPLIGKIVTNKSQPKSNPKTNRISPAKGANKLHVEDLPRTNKSHLRTTNRVDSSSRLKRTVINSNSDSMCQTCNKCLTSFDHDMCVAICMKSVMRPYSTRHNCEIERKIKQVWKPKHVKRKMKQVWKPKQVGKAWKPTGKVLTTIGHQWRPTGRILHLGKQCPLTRFTSLQVVSVTQNKKHASTYANHKYLDSGCSKHMMMDRSRLLNFMKKFIGTVRFGNDHFGAIMGYGDYVVGESVISRVYYMEGLGHNLFFVRQFYDFDLEVAFRKHSCYVRDTDGVDLIKGSRGSNLYTISVEDMMKSSSICLLSKASKNKSWLWHRCWII
nr:integrase, catalytic region, zinc finger, CCHC-type, peptidase aspartic, catalytic [Tanacetum cinerariifolium]